MRCVLSSIDESATTQADRSVAAAGTVTRSIDLDRGFDVHPQVEIRRESFGALLYHFGNRRLSFVKDPLLARVLLDLGQSATVREALALAGVHDPEAVRRYARALTTLASTATIQERTG